MKNKNNLLLVAVVILVIGLLAWPAISRRKANQEKLTENTTTEEGNGEIKVAGPVGLTEEEMTKFETSSESTNGDTPPAPGMIAVKVFLHDAKKDPSYLKCDTVYPATRWIEPTPAIARAAITQLLRGITPAESRASFTTSINEGVNLNSLIIEGGVAKADFNENLTKMVAGACRVGAIRAQITETLKQFPGVNSVVISVGGKSEGVLQP